MELVIIALLVSMAVSPSLTDHIWSNPVEQLGNMDANQPMPSKDDNLDSKLNLRTVKELNIQGSIRRKFAAAVGLMKPGKNMICSPVFTLLPLGMLAFGARGASLNELNNAMGFVRDSDFSKPLKQLLVNLRHISDVTLDIASQVYVSDKIPLNDKYVADVKNTFESTIQQLDFNLGPKAAVTINTWVSKQTNDKINDLISPTQIDPATTIVLVNAIYFKGAWLTPFSSASDETFFGTGEAKSIVKMMHSKKDYRYGISEELQAKIIEIPYKGEAATLVVVLPLQRDGLTIVLHKIKLAPELLDASLRELTKRQVSLHLPMFKIETSLNLIPLYRKGDLTKIFDREDSGLTGIPKDRERKISVGEAIQKVVIEVTEESNLVTAAGSATTVTGPSFHANHPFYFFVTANLEQLFSGSFYNDAE